MADFGTGLSAVNYIAKLNRINHREYDITDFGAVGDNNTVNTTAIQAAIDEAAVSGGVVYVPSGIFKTGKLTYYNNVSIIGDGYTSILKSNAAEILIEKADNNISYLAGINNIRLDGDGVGTKGIYFRKMTGFKMNNLFITGFTICGMHLHGSLIGSFFNSFFSSSVIGVLIDMDGTSEAMASNLLSFNNCTIGLNSKYGIQATGGLMLKIAESNITINGTHGDATTGAIYYKGNNGVNGKSHNGLIIKDTWIEANYGIVVNLDEPTSGMKQLSSISESMFIINDSEAAIQVIGTNTENKLILRSCVIQDTAGVIMTGTNTKVINDQSEISGTITGTGVATGYYNLIPTLVE